MGLPVQPDLLAGFAAPVVLASGWLTVASVKRRLNARGPARASAPERSEAGARAPR